MVISSALGGTSVGNDSLTSDRIREVLPTPLKVRKQCLVYPTESREFVINAYRSPMRRMRTSFLCCVGAIVRYRPCMPRLNGIKGLSGIRLMALRTCDHTNLQLNAIRFRIRNGMVPSNGTVVHDSGKLIQGVLLHYTTQRKAFLSPCYLHYSRAVKGTFSGFVKSQERVELPLRNLTLT